MLKYLAILFLLISLNSFGQSKTTIIDKNTVVKDSGGGVLPYAIWSKLLQSGSYNLRKNPGTEEFVAYQLTEEEIKVTAERKKNQLPNMAKPRMADAFVEGEKFKGEKITDINGNKYDLRNTGDKIYVINFWFINCPPCKKEIPDLNKIVETYKDKEVVFLAIALDNRAELKSFLKSMPFTYNVVSDGRFYAQKYGVKGYPTHVIIGKDGVIKFSTLGLASNTTFWIEKTLKEQTEL